MDDANTFKTDAMHEQNPVIQDRTIVAAFAQAATAAQARQALETAGYKDIEVTSADPADADKPVHEHGFWDGLKAMFSGHHHTDTYAETVRQGNTLVTVHTEQGRSAFAVDILDGFGPIEVEGGEQAWVDDMAARVSGQDLTATASPQGDEAVSTPAAPVDDEPLEGDELPVLRWNADQGNDRVRSYTRNLPVISTPSEGSQADLSPEREPTPGAIKHAD